MALNFTNSDLKALLYHAGLRWPNGLNKTYVEDVDNLKPAPGFWIVGDDGVYLMHNGKALADELQPVAYAVE